jgi:type I restriction enzyme S subunit
MMETILLGKVFKYKKGLKPKYLFDEPIENGIPYLTAKYFRQNKPEAYTKEKDGNRFIKANIDDVILIWDGSNAGDVFKGLEGALASTMVKFEKNEIILDDFLFFFLKTKFNLLNSKTTGSTIPHVSKTILENLEIPYLPLPEQRKIAYVLSTVQKAIEQQDKLIKTTTELKKALMQKLFTEGLYGEKQKQTEIGLVPESWEVVELRDVAEKPQYGYTDSASNKGNAKFLRITDITEYGVNWDSVPFCYCEDIEKYRLKNGDIVFARIGATTGKSYIIENPPTSVFASYLIRVRCKDNIILPIFLIYYFASEMYWRQINSRKGDNLKGGVNGSILSKLLIPKPPIEEQKTIANIFNKLDKKIELALKKKQTLQDLFKTLLHELMTGQRRVNEIEFGFDFTSASLSENAQPQNNEEEVQMVAESEIKYKTDGK